MIKVAVLAENENEFANLVFSELTRKSNEAIRLADYDVIMEWIQNVQSLGLTHAFVAHRLDKSPKFVGQSEGGKASIQLRKNHIFTIGLLYPDQPTVSETLWSVNPGSYLWAIEQISER